MRAYQCCLLATVFFLFVGCGGPTHAKIDTPATHFDEYQSIYIHDVKVYSEERTANGNLELQKKLRLWQQTARADLEGSIGVTRFALTDTPTGDKGRTLVVDLDMNVTYGNRALRFVAGPFGAGKGMVHSYLSAIDAQTGEVRFKASADSELEYHASSTDDAVRENTRQLIGKLGSALRK